MGDYLLHVGALGHCDHEFPAAPRESNPRVLVSGQPTIVAGATFQVIGCTFGSGNSPCTIGTWTGTASRVSSMNNKLILVNSDSTSVPNDSPFHVTSSQTRVSAE